MACRCFPLLLFDFRVVLSVREFVGGIFFSQFIIFFPYLVRRVFRIARSDFFADKDVEERFNFFDLLLFVGGWVFGLDDDFLIEFADNTGSIHVQVYWVLEFRQDRTVVIFSFALDEKALIYHQIVHANFIYPTKNKILFTINDYTISSFIHLISILPFLLNLLSILIFVLTASVLLVSLPFSFKKSSVCPCWFSFSFSLTVLKQSFEHFACLVTNFALSIHGVLFYLSFVNPSITQVELAHSVDKVVVFKIAIINIIVFKFKLSFSLSFSFNKITKYK